MSDPIKIAITGITETQRFLENRKDKIQKLNQDTIKEATLFMEGEVKSSIAGQRAEKRSIDTGRFLNSVTSKSNDNEGVVFTEVEYAKFLEYGTSRFQARAHFRNSKFRNQEKITNFFNDALKKLNSI